MRKKWLSVLLTICIWLNITPILPITASAEIDGIYTYTVSDGQATITKCDTSASGELIVPSTLGGYPVTTIGRAAFCDCRSLIRIIIPEGVTQLKNAAFEECINLTDIMLPESLTNIGSRSFNKCSSLTSITIPGNVSKISNSAFNGCSSLAEIFVDTENEYYCSVNGTLFDFDKTELIRHPAGKINSEYEIPEGTTIIGNYAFYECQNLTSIVMPKSATSIGDYTFERCVNLATITLPKSITHIGESAFYYCYNLTEITIPDSMTNIGNSTFYGCRKLASVTFSKNVTEIGDSAFYNCNKLKDVYFNGSESDWTNINIGSDNESLTNATIHYNYVVEPPIYTSYTVENGQATITKCDTSASGDIEIPSILEGCPVTNIKSYAFNNCNKITSITIPKSITDIGNNAFYGCSSLVEINVDFENEYYCSVNGILFDKDKTKLIKYPAGNKRTEYVIPNSVIFIQSYAFDDCNILTSVTIPDGITTIEQSVFYNCSGLTRVVIPDEVKSIGAMAFQGCSSLTDVTIPEGVTTIADSTFWGCSSLENIVLPKTVKNIGKYVFYDCSSLKSINIPAGVTVINIALFSGCSSLANITIPDGVTSIGNYAFQFCSSLTSITIPENVTDIGHSAFNKCTNLTNAIILNGMTNIGQFAFSDCETLKSVTIPKSVTTIAMSAFIRCFNLKDVYYGGNEAEWNQIEIGNNNDCLTKATIHYNHSTTPGKIKKLEYSSNQVIAEITLTNPEETSNAFLLLYDVSGNLIGIDYKPISSGTEDFDLIIERELSIAGTYSVKFMLWNKNLNPYMKAITKTLEVETPAVA